MSTDSSNVIESTYVVRGKVSAEAITTSLQALLPARHHPIGRQRHTLLDTFDGRVRRAGARLARSGVNGTCTMTWQTRRGNLTVRLKQPACFASDLPDSPLRRVLAPVIGVRRLLAQAETEEYGSLLEILDGRAKTVARLRVESGRARLPLSSHAWQRLPTVVTVTGLRGYEDVYARLLPLISSRPGIEPSPEDRDGVILGQLGAPGGMDVSLRRVDLGRTVRADVGARQIHLALLAILEANEPGLRASLDTEFLHDFRVAVRRTRSLLRQIRHVFPLDVVDHFSTEFSWIGRLTGPPRDLDVLILALRSHGGGVPPDDMEVLTALFEQARLRMHDGLVEALDSGRYRRLLTEWRVFLERPARSEPDTSNAGRPLADVVSQRARRLSRRIAACAGTIDASTAAEHLHTVRIDTKKLRYLVDVTSVLYDASDLESILGPLKRLQRVLGDYNDAHVQERRLLECGATLEAAGGRASTLLALGRLAEQCRQRRQRLHEQVVDALARFRSRRTRSACRRAFANARARDSR